MNCAQTPRIFGPLAAIPACTNEAISSELVWLSLRNAHTLQHSLFKVRVLVTNLLPARHFGEAVTRWLLQSQKVDFILDISTIFLKCMMGKKKQLLIFFLMGGLILRSPCCQVESFVPTVSKIRWAVIWKTIFDTVQSCTGPVREVRWPWDFDFDFVQRGLFLSGGGLTPTLLAPVGLRCLFLSFVSVPLQHESCNWTPPTLLPPPEALRKHILPALSSTSPPPSSDQEGRKCSVLSHTSSINVNSLSGH